MGFKRRVREGESFVENSRSLHYLEGSSYVADV